MFDLPQVVAKHKNIYLVCKLLQWDSASLFEDSTEYFCPHGAQYKECQKAIWVPNLFLIKENQNHYAVFSNEHFEAQLLILWCFECKHVACLYLSIQSSVL